MSDWRAVCRETGKHGSEGGRWKRAEAHLASVLPYTNLFWAQGRRPVLPRCAGFPRGVGDVADLLATWFLDRYGRELSSIEQRDILWSAVQRKPHRPIFVDGRAVELGAETQRMIAQVGMNIRSQ